MPMLDTAIAAQLALTLVLLFFFRLAARHDPRPYLRAWTAAWAAQALALAALAAGPTPLLLLWVLGQAVYGLLVLKGSWDFSRGPLPAVVFPVAAAGALLLAGAGPAVLSAAALQASVHGMLAATHAGAAALLWPLREPGGWGIRGMANALGLLSLLFASLALAPALTSGGAGTSAVLVVQTFFGLAVVLAVAEAAQWALTATHQQLKEAQHRLKVLGETDALTGCFNRQVFRELVDDLRSGGRGQHGVVLLLDLEGFRELNEREGHAAGDDALRRAAEAIRGRTRSTDVLVRWGGDEFVLVLQGVGHAEAQARSAEIAEALGRAGLAARSGLGAYGPGSDIMAAVHEAEQGQAPGSGRRQAEA